MQAIETTLPGHSSRAYHASSLTCSIMDITRPTTTRTLARLGGLGTTRKFPVGADEVASVPIRIFFKIILVFRLGFPKWTGRRGFCNDLAWTKPRRLDVRDGVFRNPLLFSIDVINS